MTQARLHILQHVSFRGPAITVGEETTVEEIAVLFDGRGINRVPVVTNDGRLRGIVSRGDIVRTVGAAQ